MKNTMRLVSRCLGTVWLAAMALASGNALAVDAAFGQLNFDVGSTIGEAAPAGFSYRYPNVLTGVDAILTVTRASRISSDYNIDFTPNVVRGVDFHPAANAAHTTDDGINSTIEGYLASSGTPGLARYEILFVASGSNTPVTVENIAVVVRDIDFDEFVEFNGITNYRLSNTPPSTLIASQQSNGGWRFASDGTGCADSTVLNCWVEVRYGSTNSLEITLGVRSDSVARFGISLQAGDWGGNDTVTNVTPVSYTITYNGNGADSGSVPSPTSGTGALTIAGNTGSLTKQGFAFESWNTDPLGGGIELNGGDSFTPSNDLTLYAQFRDPSSTVVAFSQSSAYSSSEGVGTSNAVTLTRSGLTDNSSSVQVSITGGTATGGGTDYTSSGFPMTVNFAAGETSKTVPVPIVDDTLYETVTAETITFSIGSPTGASLGSQTTASLNIVENDSQPSVTLGLTGSPLAENGGVATLTATLSHRSVENVTANLGFAGTATGSGTDYTASATGIQVAAGSMSNTATLTGDDDALDEDNETIIVDVDSVTNGSESGIQRVTATITDDDVTPTLSIDDVSENEGNSGTASFDFTVSLSAASGRTVTVVYGTADDTATTADNDYTSVAGTTLTFNPGDTSKTATVLVNGDAKHEADDAFLVNLSSPSNASLSDAQGTGTITNDDGVPSLSIDDVNVGAEGGIAEFTVTLSAVSGQSVTVDATTADGSAEAGEDFDALATTVLTFNPGETTQTVQVQTTDDSLEEGAETFTVQLSNPVNATLDDGEGTGTIPANDDDGVDGGTEGNVPGANGGTGDGNGDGIPDAEQGDVASIPTFDGEDWGTIEALDGHILTGVSAQAAPQSPAGVTFPYDMFSFTVTGVSASETVRMSAPDYQ